MNIRALPYALSVAKYASTPDGIEGFYSLSVTEGEISLVAETEKLPIGFAAREDGWRALAVEGPLDFSLVGILAKISSALADAGIPIFAISTFDTDYILVKESRFTDACNALKQKGYILI